MTSDSYSDAKTSSTLTPAPSGGRKPLITHSHRLEDLLEASSFVSAWDLYVELISHCPSVARDLVPHVGTSLERNVCATPFEPLEARKRESVLTGHYNHGQIREDGSS